MDGSLAVGAKHPEKITTITIDSSGKSAAELRSSEGHYLALFGNGAGFFVTETVLLIGEVPEFIKTHGKQIKCNTLALNYHNGCLAETSTYFVGFSELKLNGEIGDDTAKDVIGLPRFSVSKLDVQHLVASHVSKLENLFRSADPIELVLSLEGFTKCQKAIFEGMGKRSTQVITVTDDNGPLIIIEMYGDTATVQYMADTLIAHFQLAVLAVPKVAFWQFVPKQSLIDVFFSTAASGWKTEAAAMYSKLTGLEREHFKQTTISNRTYLYRFV